MGRTQVYLGTDELELLDRVGRPTGADYVDALRGDTNERLDRLGAE